jgi:glycosyltransferase involved in cell wall biosynthesis
VARGFETHISQLSQFLKNESLLQKKVEVYGGGYGNSSFKSVWCIRRNSRLARLLSSNPTIRYRLEQHSFFFFMIPNLLWHRPEVIYLAEYQLYCHLYRFRNFFGLNYGLIHYTGGMALPAMFDPSKDRVHHVSPLMLKRAEMMTIPIKCQFLIPHFFSPQFTYNPNIINAVRKMAGSKRITLTVAAVNRSFKRVDVVVEQLGNFAEMFFPVIIGEFSEETKAIRIRLQELFGDNFLLLEVNSHSEMGSYYAAADYFVHAGDRESFGLVFLEALWHGLPIVAHRDEVTEFVLHDKAIIFNTYDMMEWRRALQGLLEHSLAPAKDSSKTAMKEFVAGNYSWDALRLQYLHLFLGRE